MIKVFIFFLLFYHPNQGSPTPSAPTQISSFSRTNRLNRYVTQHITFRCDLTTTSSGHICTALDLVVLSPNITMIRVSSEYSQDISINDVINLIISRQNIQFIPEGLSYFFRNLEILTIFSSNLRQLRFTDFLGLATLRKMFIQGNAIESIDPRTFQAVPQLEVLDLTDNKIVSLPFDAFADSKDLKILTLSRNSIKIFDIFPLPVGSQLTELRLDGNQLARMNLSSIRNCRYLKVLDLGMNDCIDGRWMAGSGRALVEFYTDILEACNED